MAQARVVVLNETKIGNPNEWNLCFQYCRYEYGDENSTEKTDIVSFGGGLTEASKELVVKQEYLQFRT